MAIKNVSILYFAIRYRFYYLLPSIGIYHSLIKVYTCIRVYRHYYFNYFNRVSLKCRLFSKIFFKIRLFSLIFRYTAQDSLTFLMFQ